MRWLIRHYHSRAGSGQNYSDRVLDTSTLHIGRGTDQDVQLNGVTVALRHATLELHGRDRLGIEAHTLSGVEVNGAPTRSAELQAGDEVQIGPHRLRIGRTAEGGKTRVLEVIESPSGATRPPPASTWRLDQTTLSNRRSSLLLLMLVLVLGLLLPLVSRMDNQAAEIVNKLPALGQQLWNTGRISKVHGHFGDDCRNCHEQPFQPVANSACQDCHAFVPHHTDDAELQGLEFFKDIRCAQCHQEHRGGAGLITHNPRLCTSCHRRPEQFAQYATLQAVENFQSQHPDFKSLAESTFDSGLRFSHAVHLAEAGIRGPQGTETLNCQSCHIPDAGQVAFRSLSMPQHCQRCHNLAFDPDSPDVELPHGNQMQVEEAIRSHFARRAFEGRFGAPASSASPFRPARRHKLPTSPADPQAWAHEQSRTTIEEVVRHRICSKCHVVVEDGTRWQVKTVDLPERWLQASRFTHRPHRTQPCLDCHQAANSESSQDLLLPGIANCRECHRNADSRKGLATSCVDCHQMHRARGELQSATRARQQTSP